MLATIGAITELGDHDRAQAKLVRRGALHPSHHLRMAAAEVVDAHVGVEQVPHSSPEARHGLGRRDVARIREIARGSREGEKAAAPRTPPGFEHNAVAFPTDVDLTPALEAILAR